MKHKFEMFQSVILVRDIDQNSDVGLSHVDRVCAGNYGVVVDYLIDSGVAVELFDGDGWTVDVVFAPENYFRALTREELKELESRPQPNFDRLITPNP